VEPRRKRVNERNPTHHRILITRCLNTRIELSSPSGPVSVPFRYLFTAL
jgi:hypothetical protein